MESGREPHEPQGPADAPVGVTVAGGRIGLARGEPVLRRRFEVAFWLGAAPLPMRVLRRVGAGGAAAWLERRWAKGVARTLDLRIDLHGLDQIDPGTAYVVTPLHEGFADVLALLQLPLSLRFVVRDELLGWPLLGPHLRATKQIVIRPETGPWAYRQVLRDARGALAVGESVVMFPQGTILGIETAFQPGPFALARSLGYPILPLALTGAHRVWEHPYTPRLRRGQRMSLRVLPPIPAVELRSRSVDAIRRQVQDRLKVAALGGDMAPPRRFVPTRDGYWDGYAYEIDPAFPDLAEQVRRYRDRAANDERDRQSQAEGSPS